MLGNKTGSHNIRSDNYNLVRGEATISRICEQCGEKFVALLKRVTAGRGRFCGRSCHSRCVMRRRHALASQRGDGNPNWKGGISQINTRYTNRFRQANPHKVRAHTIVARALSSGCLVRPAACSQCNVPCKPHGHHDDYSQPLSVRWLCRTCHLAHHNAQKQSA